MPDPSGAELLRVLGEVQRRGGIGRTDLEAEIRHARSYVDRLPPGAGLLADLGSGGGLPALVIAMAAPSWQVVLIERRAKRADLLRFAVRALRLDDRARVVDLDAAAAATSPELAGRCEVVTARAFGPLNVVLATAAPFLVPGGCVLVSDPPGRVHSLESSMQSWRDAGSVGGIHRFEHIER